MADAPRTGKISALSSIDIVLNTTCMFYLAHTLSIVTNRDVYQAIPNEINTHAIFINLQAKNIHSFQRIKGTNRNNIFMFFV